MQQGALRTSSSLLTQGPPDPPAHTPPHWSFTCCTALVYASLRGFAPVPSAALVKMTLISLPAYLLGVRVRRAGSTPPTVTSGKELLVGRDSLGLLPRCKTRGLPCGSSEISLLLGDPQAVGAMGTGVAGGVTDFPSYAPRMGRSAEGGSCFHWVRTEPRTPGPAIQRCRPPDRAS